MTTASGLIRRALRHINVPGRGAALSAQDTNDAFEALQELLDSNSITKQFVPGIRRHFFPLTASQAIYKYGPGAQADFRSDDFDDDPAPIRVEDAFIRAGSTITDNELVGNYRFEYAGVWFLSGTAVMTNNRLVMEDVAGASQDVDLVGGTPYTLRVRAEVLHGSATLEISFQGADDVVLDIDNSGEYEIDLVRTNFGTVNLQVTTLAGDSVEFSYISIIERGKDRLALPDGRGSDYLVKPWDQKGYNRDFAKGNAGRPYRYLYSRDYPLPTIRLDQSAGAGDILVLDVLVNRVQVSSLNSTIRLHPDAIMWLGYALADHVAGDYGKMLKPRQITLMNEAWDNLAAGNQRVNKLRVDQALMGRPTFNINRGDP